jgi:hypothetical protein
MVKVSELCTRLVKLIYCMKTRVLVLLLLLAVLTADSQNRSVEAVKISQVPKIDGKPG